MEKEINIQITKEQEERLAENYNNYIERKEEFEKFSHLKVVKALNNYQNCIIQNTVGNFILGKVYKNCITIGASIIKEFEKIEELENLDEEQIKDLEEWSKM